MVRTPWAQATLGLTVLILAAALVHLIAQRYLLGMLRRIVHRSRNTWDELLFDSKLPQRALFIIPLLVLQMGIVWVPELPLGLATLIQRLVSSTMIIVGALTLDSALTAAHTIYLRLPLAGTRPIKSYVQLAKVFIYAVAAIFVVATLANQSPWFFVSGLGAMMAIIMLIFRDTILSLVASVQLTNNDLIRVGDWIEMPDFGADGDVVDIALNTVKVVNWDKTATIIPTHKFLDNSFRNWRNMFETGGRRIKRSVYINTSTIRFLTEEEIERFSRFALLEDYMRAKREELEAYNSSFDHDPSIIANERRLTNIGTLRAYITSYLRNHPEIHQDLTFLVRQLAPTPEGVPIEIYVFTRNTSWFVHEDVQGDIFDHILTMIPEFGLSVYQRPAGTDLQWVKSDAIRLPGMVHSMNG